MERRCLTALLLIVCLALPTAMAIPVNDRDRSEPAPPVDKPDGSGSYTVGYNLDSIQTSTKTYSVNLKIYYPATGTGEDATADTGDAPYPAVVWLPGFGGSEIHYQGMLSNLASWGFAVMAVGVNWTDFPDSGNISDVEDFLDHLEARNGTVGDVLEGMIDSEAYGLSGHSSGGGLTLADGAYVDRLKAVQPFAAAIATGSVDGIADDYDKPLCLQVGQQDNQYIEGSRRAFEKVDSKVSLWESIGQGHQGPWQDHIFHAFYLYHLRNETGYYPYLYGEDAVEDHLANRVDLGFKISQTHFFPPVVSAVDVGGTYPMDQDIQLNGSISGYWLEGDQRGSFDWDVDGDGTVDLSDPDDMNATHAYGQPGLFDVDFMYNLGRLRVGLEEPIKVTIENVGPVARAGSDVSLEEDEAHHFDASSSQDTVSDNGSLEYRWVFGDGAVRDYSSDPLANHTYTDEGAYTVTLKVRDPWDATSEDELSVTVSNVAPLVDAGADLSGQEDTPVEFAGTGDDTASDAGDLEFMWDFGDGNASQWSDEATATHTYMREDNYTAVLSVRDDDGETVTDAISVAIDNVEPFGGISSPDNGTEFQEDDLVEFVGWGQDTRSDLYSLEYRWDPGDGTVTDWRGTPVVSHVYTSAGNYTAIFSIRDDDGAVADHRISIVVVNLAPTAEIEEPAKDVTVYEDETVSFSGTGEDSETDMGNLTYEWIIDGATMNGTGVEHAFGTSGEHEVTFRVTDPDGTCARATLTVTVRNRAPTLTASLSPLSVNVSGTVQYSATPGDTPTDQGDLEVEWDFGDGNRSTDLSGAYTFETAGTYIVKVTVTDDDGATASDKFTVLVREIDDGGGGGDGGDDENGLGDPLVLAAIGAVIAVVVILAVLLLMRRGGRGSAVSEPGPAPAPSEFPDDMPVGGADQDAREPGEGVGEGPAPEEALDEEEGVPETEE